MATENLIVERWPGGHATISSAKKRIPEKFSRPWQKDYPDLPVNCVFEKDEERSQALITHKDPDDEQWYVIKSKFTPEEPHYLIIPHTCWPSNKLQVLGGEEKIHTAVTLANQTHQNHCVEGEVWGLSVQIGPLAAQNQPHLHYHLYRPNLIDRSGAKILTDQRLHVVERIPVDPDYLILEEQGLQAIAGGTYTGQCFIKSNLPLVPWGQCIKALSQFLNRLICLYIEKFRSTEGLSPHYRLEIEFYGRELHYGLFTPKLNNTGTLEDMAEIDPRRGMNLLWPHQETARYLRS